jgi:predicted phage baseplate assembly protein
VTNAAPARGGADAETIGSLRERGPRAIRHRDRAVTIEDFEDLAMLASPEVARAKCVPLHDLSADPDAKGAPLPGKVSVIIVPRLTEAKPLPSRVLLERVAEYLDARRLPVVDLKIVHPDYLRVDVKAKIVLTSIDRASEVQSRVINALRRFLHPLTGGRDDAGWDFGRQPYESDLLQRISEIPGVDHVSSLMLTDKLDRDGGAKTWALVYAGSLDIAVAAGR